MRDGDALLPGLFSGFPAHHFTDEIAQVLLEDLSGRESPVFIGARPGDCVRNDDDSNGFS